MARSSKRKKGKAARAARRGLLGLSNSTHIGEKKSGKFKKRSTNRQEKEDEKRAEEILRENISADDKPAVERRPPHSFVIHVGNIGRFARRLEGDLKRLLSPHTSKELKVKKWNNFKDFVVNSSFLGVSHLVVLSRSALSVNLRIIRNPHGPTLHFKVEKYSLARDILASQKRPTIYEELFQNAPLVVMSGFAPQETTVEEKHLRLVQVMVTNMFPEIDIDRLKLGTIRRTLLLHYNTEEDVFELRHYSIKTVPSGVCRSAKKLMQSKVPDLSKYEDISDFMLRPGQLSDSEFEGEQVELELPQDIGGRGKKAGQQTKLRLVEIGPRMSLRLVKIVAGVNNSGEVLFHSLVEKDADEVATLRKQASTLRKRRIRQEKKKEHETIRRMRARAQKHQQISEQDDKRRQSLIEQQREVTGDYSSDDDYLGEEEKEEKKEKVEI